MPFAILTGVDGGFGWPEYMLRVYQGNLPPSWVAILFNLSLPAGLEFYSDTCNFVSAILPVSAQVIRFITRWYNSIQDDSKYLEKSNCFRPAITQENTGMLFMSYNFLYNTFVLLGFVGLRSTWLSTFFLYTISRTHSSSTIFGHPMWHSRCQMSCTLNFFRRVFLCMRSMAFINCCDEFRLIF